MLLEGSCHCGAVRFSLQSRTPAPYMLCYCSICRKTAGGGGYAINIMGLAGTLEVSGGERLKIYSAKLAGGETSPGQHRFCGDCGSALWMADPRWPELVHPFASAIDTPLPHAPQRVLIMENHRPAWAELPGTKGDLHFGEYPQESIEQWHERQGLLEEID